MDNQKEEIIFHFTPFNKKSLHSDIITITCKHDGGCSVFPRMGSGLAFLAILSTSEYLELIALFFLAFCLYKSVIKMCEHHG
jgi:hypothetical protein